MHFFDRVKPRFPQLFGPGIDAGRPAGGGLRWDRGADHRSARGAGHRGSSGRGSTDRSVCRRRAPCRCPTYRCSSTHVPTKIVASPEVNPGKVTWMVGSFSNERMHYCLAGGGGHDYGRQLHAFVISSDVKDGARVLIPGVASDWELSADGQDLGHDYKRGGQVP